jgi:tRNA-2-methylthio-N6-dimethylallyladenosine synthase
VRDVAQGNDDRRSEILYVNHAFDPLFGHMQRTAPQVELFFRINDLGYIPAVMRKLGYDVKEDIDIISEYTGIIPHNANQLFKENTKTAYVPISTGCSQFCAYCIVPYARGLEKNRPMDEIYAEVKEHLNNGVEEIVLLGQIVNKHPDFAQILRDVSAMKGVRWLRYTSPYPTYYNEEILALHE